VQECVQAEHPSCITQDNDDSENNIGLIDAWSPRDGGLCAEVIDQQEKRKAGRGTRGQAKDKRDRDINFSDDRKTNRSSGASSSSNS